MRVGKSAWSVLLAGVVMAATTVAVGQAKGQMGGEKMDAQSHLQHLSQELNLTPEQQEKLKPILQDEWSQVKEMRENSSLTPEQKKARAKEIHEKYEPQISAILTPEQQAKWQKMKQEAWQKHKEGMKMDHQMDHQ